MVAPTEQALAYPRLPATSWAVLGILSFGEEISGYDLKKWADYSIRYFYWSPSFSQVYSELKKLETLGFASSRNVVEDEARVKPKRLYTITEAGLAVVSQWARQAPVEAPMLKHGVMLRMWLGHLNGPEDLKSILREHISNIEKTGRQAALDAQDSAMEPSWAFAHMVGGWSQRYYAAERELAQQMLDEIDEASQKVPPADAPGHPGVPKPIRPHDVPISKSEDTNSEYSGAISCESGTPFRLR